jgi:membrane-anchored protein YejM (alkaline phosphatase superfamily)
VINPDQNETARDWQLMFISVPVILLIEMLFATWSWQKLRSLTRRRHYAKPVAALFFVLYCHARHVYLGGCELLSPYYHAAREPAALLPDDGPSFP